MGKHTPGKWYWIESDEYGYAVLTSKSGDVLELEGRNDGDYPIMWILVHNPADKDLIAAAPDLLVALQDAQKAIESLPYDALGMELGHFEPTFEEPVPLRDNYYPLRDELLAKLDAAIAKATREADNG